MQGRDFESGDLPPVEQASELASPWARLAAVIIDGLIVGIPSLLFWLLAFASLISEGDESSLALVLASLVIIIVIFIIQMVLLGTRGQTIGKIALKIRIVDAQTGAHTGWPRLVLLRAIVNAILTSIPFLGTIYWIVDSLFIFRADRRTIHDLYSGTRVDKL
ncbi:MAG: RDD family protein [Dehalococcoidia bacterium]|nr:RDD family protein [Dehalococcoidia bacterium]